MKIYFTAAFLLLLPLKAFSGFFSTDTYDECLLENLKDADRYFEIEITRACGRKHPATVPKNEVDLIVYIIKSGELMKERYNKAVYD